MNKILSNFFITLILQLSIGTLGYKLVHSVQHSHQNYKKFDNLAFAVSEVIDADFNSGVKTTNFILPHSSNTNIKDFVEALLSISFASFKSVFRQESLSRLSASDRPKHYVVIVVEHFEHFLEIHQKLMPQYFKFNGQYIIVLIRGAIREIQKILQLVWELQIYNVNVMFENDNGTVSVQTFIPFKTFKCNDTSPVLIGEFKNGKFFGGKRKLFPEKMKNLFGCPIRVSLSNSSEPFIIIKYHHDGT